MDFRLFISHSSPTEDSRERLLRLMAGIEAASRPDTPIRVLVDAGQIAGGDDWRRRIAFMLHACHGGVVLVDDAALSSKWVLGEAAFLSLRQRAERGFPFIPVSFLNEPDLERARQARKEQHQFLTDTAWDVVGFSDVQYVSGQSAEQIAQAIVVALRTQGSLRPMASPADRLADQLAPKFAAAGAGALRALADEMWDAASYQPRDDRERAALAIVQHMLRCGRLLSTLRRMDGLGNAFGASRRLEILDELSPLPLPAEGAAMLTRRRESGGYAHAIVRTETPSFTVPLYVRRAHLALMPPPSFAIANTFGSFADLQANLRLEWRRRHGGQLTDDQVDERLNDPGLDIYVWVPGPLDDDVLAGLEDAYPRIAFIIHYSGDSPPTALPPGVLPLTPPLSRTDENAISVDYDNVKTSLAGGGAR
jgi:hypothetical protein